MPTSLRFLHRFRAFAVFAVTVILACMVGVTASCTPRVPTDYVFFHVYLDGQPTLGLSKKNKALTGLVVFFHGLDTDEHSMISDPTHKQLTDSLLNAGYAVVSSNAGGNSYGNPASRQNYLDLARMAAYHYHVTDIYLLAESMGAIAAVDILATPDTLPVRGLAAISPALDLDNAPPPYRSAIEAAYPGQSIDSVSPMNLPPDQLLGKKVRFYASQDDKIVPTADNAAAFEDRFGTAAAISIVPCTGGHLAPSCIQGDDIVRWYRSL
jgi:predicted alpha/beta hydrolase family esterase